MYLVPPKLNKKYLLGFWTPLELLIIVLLLVTGTNSILNHGTMGSLLLSIAGGIMLVTARFDLEVNLLRVFVIRTRYIREPKTYSQAETAVKNKKARERKAR